MPTWLTISLKTKKNIRKKVAGANTDSSVVLSMIGKHKIWQKYY